MKCSNCGHENASDAYYCTKCNNSLGISSTNNTTSNQVTSATPAYNSAASQAQQVAPAQPAAAAYSSSPAYTSVPARPVPYAYQQPYYYPPASIKPKQQFTITDAYIIIGFVLSVIGIFTYAFILLPAGIGFSVIGFVRRTNARTLGLSVAGIVIGVVACFIRVGMLLNELGIIPNWLSSGIF